uniref:Uncharacterized protein n=2 Tax=Aegilops tauschii subsp. strangulata TaxID=200361 RepID=A0A453F3X8_AEGTS
APFQAALDYFTQGPDFVVRGMSSASSSQFPASTERESTTANDNAIPHDPGADSAGPAQSRLSLQLDQRSLHFSVNAWVLIVALIGIIPLATRQLQLKGYRLSLLGTTCTTGYAIFALYGLPRVGNTQAVQAWCHHVTSSKDFIPFMYCLMFVTSKLHLKRKHMKYLIFEIKFFMLLPKRLSFPAHDELTLCGSCFGTGNLLGT